MKLRSLNNGMIFASREEGNMKQKRKSETKTARPAEGGKLKPIIIFVKLSKV